MQDYKLIIRAITNGVTQRDPNGQVEVQNYAEFMAYLGDTYLSQGYTIHTVQNLRNIPASNGQPGLYEFAYHLVKDVTKAK